MTPWPRRVLQALAMGVVIAAPALGIWSVGSARAWAPEELAWRYGPLAEPATRFLSTALGQPTDEAVGTVVGGTWSMRVLGVELADPIAAAVLTTGGGLNGAAGGLLLGAAAVLLFQVLTGRFFCGYLCPYGTLSRLVTRLRRPLDRRGLVLHLQPPAWTRGAVLAAVLVAPLLGLSLVSLALPYLGVVHLVHSAFFGGLAATVGWVGALLLSDLLLWEHGICRSICPSGLAQRELGRWRVLRLVSVRSRSCSRGCHMCEEACWLGLDPRGGAPDNDCDGCGRCSKVCPNNRLTLGLGRKTRRAAVVATVVLGGAVGASTVGCTSQAPSPIQLTPGVSTPFMPPAEGLAIDRGAAAELSSGESGAPARFVELEGGGEGGDGVGLVSVGCARTPDGTSWLRLYLEESPGEPWRGPLTVEIRNSAGTTTMEFDRPREPRSTPRPTLYEGAVVGSHPLRLRFVDGPAAGTTLVLPDPRADPGQQHRRAALPGLVVVAIWALGLGLRRARRDRAPALRDRVPA